MSETLLPSSATKHERDVEASIRRASDLPALNRHVWNPDLCPADLLPWLAWAMSVDVWNPDWPESVKRSAIRASAQVHRKKGTIGALRKAIEALDFGIIRLEEWHKYGGTPYTFRLWITLGSRGITPQESALIDETIRQTKNVRSHLDDFRLYVESRGAVPNVHLTSLSGEAVTVYPYSVTEVESRGTVPTLGGSFYGVDTMTVYPGSGA